MDKSNVTQCLVEVSRFLSDFLKKEGGWENGYRTYVGGTVSVDYDGSLVWMTPLAEEELTDKGRERRGKQLYKNVQKIMAKYGVDRLYIRYKETGYGAMVTDVAYVQETKVVVNL